MHFSVYLSINSPSISPPHAYTSYRRDRFADRFTRAPSLRSSRSRSLTLPLDEDADGVTGQGTDNKELTSIHDTANHEHRGNAAVKSTARRLQNGKTKADRVLKPVSSKISKPSPKGRGLRRRKLEQQHGATCLGEKTGNSRKTRPVGPQDSNFTSPATFPIHQPDQPGNLNDQPNSPDQEVQSHRASIGLHPEGGQRVTRSRARAPESKLSTTRNAGSLASSMAHKRSRQKPAQGARHSKQENRQKSSREDKTRSGRVSKRPERFGFT